MRPPPPSNTPAPASSPLPGASPKSITGPVRGSATSAPTAPALIDGEVRRILILRALVLGDTICAVPALRAIRRAWPQAHIALMGLPVAREYLSRVQDVGVDPLNQQGKTDAWTAAFVRLRVAANKLDKHEERADGVVGLR